MRSDLTMKEHVIEAEKILVRLWRDSMHCLAILIKKQLQDFYQTGKGAGAHQHILLPEYNHYPQNALSSFIISKALSKEEIIVLIIAMVNHLDPAFFDDVVQKNLSQAGDFPELGGTRGKNFRGFLPTAETALFLLAGTDLEKRLLYQKIFENHHLFSTQNILWLEDVPPGEPRMSGRIILSPEYIELFTTGKVAHPKLSLDFPAQHLTTEMEWYDLVLNESTRQQINELENWVKYHHTLMKDWGMNKKLKPGYRALFYGPPGTGKTLTASLLGKYTGLDVFKIDLSMVVSKFIGETEKNLSQLFNRAENKNWILFFDEADALFSKRTNVRDAHDKYANQEAAYLLQRIETFDGLVILATNFKNNIDDAFIRRFHTVIHFPPPTAAERLQIWKKGIPSNATQSNDVDLSSIAKKYELTGSGIMNVIHFACLQTLSQQSDQITNETLLSGIRKEYLKEGKMW